MRKYTEDNFSRFRSGRFYLIMLIFAVIIFLLFIFIYNPFINRYRSNNTYKESFESESLSDLWSVQSELSSSGIKIHSLQNNKYIFDLGVEKITDEINLKYIRESFEGENSKVVLKFELLSKLNSVVGSISYVLDGSSDHGSYQNYVVDGVPYVVFKNSEFTWVENGFFRISIKNDYDKRSADIGGTPLDISLIDAVRLTYYGVGGPGKENVVSGKLFGLEGHLINNQSSFFELVSSKGNFSDLSNIADEILRLPSDGSSSVKLCSGFGTYIDLSRNYDTRLFKNNILFFDVKTVVGLAPVEVEVDNGLYKEYFTLNKFQSQGSWVRIALDTFSFSKNIKLSIKIRNNENIAGENCILVDNVNFAAAPIISWLNSSSTFLEKYVFYGSTYKKSNGYYFHRIDLYDLLSESQISVLENHYNELGIPIYKVYTNEDDFLTKNSLEEYSDAIFVANDMRYNAEIRLRGEGYIHWISPTKSLRVNLKNDAYFNRKNSINFIVPESRGWISEYFSYYLAEKLGLMSFDSKMVFLVMNDRPYGLMYEIEQWGTDFIDKNKKPVGDLYGDNAMDGDTSPPYSRTYYSTNYKARHNRLLNDWKKYSASEVNPNDYTNLFLLTESINSYNYDNFVSIIDKDSLLAWNVHSLLLGSTHQDVMHNDRLYFNPASGLFEFVPCDVRMNVSPANFYASGLFRNYNPYVDQLLANPTYFNMRNSILYNYVSKIDNLGRDLLVLSDVTNSVRKSIKMTTHYDQDNTKIIDNNTIESIVSQNLVGFNDYMELIKDKLEYNPKIIAKFHDTKDGVVITIKNAEDLNDFISGELVSVIGADKYKLYLLENPNINNLYSKNRDKLLELQIGDTSDLNYSIPSYFQYQMYINRSPFSIPADVYSKIREANILSNSEKSDLNSSYNRDLNKPFYFINTNDKDESRLAYFKRLGVIDDYRGLVLVVKGENINTIDLIERIDFEVINPHTKSKLQVIKEPSDDDYFPFLQNNDLVTKIDLSDIERSYPKKDRQAINISSYEPLNNVGLSIDEFANKYKSIIDRVDLNEKIAYVRSGTYDIDYDIFVPSGINLVIESGAVLRFGKGRSLISFGEVNAFGKENEKIVFTAIDIDYGWGVVALLREKAKGNFRNVIFEYGNSKNVLGLELSGVVSAYYADLSLEDSVIRFSSSNSGDDGVNVKYGNAKIINNHFVDNGSDSLDLDYVNPESIIKNNKFLNSGNDGLDVSGVSSLSIDMNLIAGSGDKGISIGEGANVTLYGNIINNNNIGIASKDDSIVNCATGEVNKNKLGLAVYNKKKFYYGGKIKIAECTMFENNQTFGIEEISEEDFRHDIPEYYSSIVFPASYVCTETNKVFNEIIKDVDISSVRKRKVLFAYLSNNPDLLGGSQVNLIEVCNEN